MLRRAAQICWCILALTTAVAFSSTTVHARTEWTLHRTDDGRHPDGREQAMLWLMNRARQDPSREGRWLANAATPSIAAGRETYRIDRRMLIREFDAIQPSPPAAFDARLYRAAVEHARDQIKRDTQDHHGQLLRVTRSGVDWRSCRGNVFSYASNALNTHAAFNIDWGNGPGGMQSRRGHRRALMATDRPYTNVGLAAIVERNAASNVGELVVVGNYCSYFTNASEFGFNRFVVGTVWSDRNGNALFDAGEGVSGVTVTPDVGPYYAVTSRGGGYAFPIRADVDLKISFEGGGIPPTTRQARVGKESVLVDYQFDRGGRVDEDNSATQETTAGPVTWLAVGQRDEGEYGSGLGANAHSQQIEFNFIHPGDGDYELQVKGIDIDTRGDVEFFVNDIRSGRLRTTGSATADGPRQTLNRLVISARQLKSGVNSIRFVQRNNDKLWGVTGILLRDRSGPKLTLSDAPKGEGPFGFGTRGAGRQGGRNPVNLHAVFDGQNRDLTLSGVARYIDYDGAVWVYLNGSRIATLPVTKDAQKRAFSIELPRRRQLDGENSIEFRLHRAGAAWSVEGLRLAD